MKWNLPRQIILMSKYMFIGIFMQFFLIGLLMANSGVGQNKSLDRIYLSVRLDNVKLSDAIEHLEAKTGFEFIYFRSILKKKKNLALNLDNESLGNILRDIAKQTDLRFKRVNNKIYIDKHIKKPVKLEEVFEEKLQQQKISGNITSAEDGEPLPGVSILIKGTTNGTTTDISGNFTLFASPEDIIEFSFIGYESQEIKVGNQTLLNLALKPDLEQLEEVVVVGYGTQVKRDVTGSVATVEGEEILTIPTANFTNGLQGRAAGVQVQETSGTPGASVNVKIRGINSINSGTNPLWVIDGIPVDQGNIGRSSKTVGQDIMSTINPADIESIEILKDAAATAIYGSRGSNGVIIITTKSGVKGKGTGNLTFNYNTGVSTLTQPYDQMGFANTQEWFEIMDRAKAGNGRDEWTPAETMVSSAFVTPISREEALQVNTSWDDVVLRNASFHDANLAYTHGLEKGSIYASFNYRKDISMNVGNEFTRVSGRINMDLEPVKNFKIGTKLNTMFTNNYRTKSYGGNAGSGGGFNSLIGNTLPWYPVYDDNDPSGYWNPIANNAATIDRDLQLDNKKTYRVLGGLYAEYNIPWVKGLALRTEGSADVIQDNTVDWVSGTKRGSGLTYAFNGSYTKIVTNYNVLLKYNNKIGKDHKFNVVAGTERFAKNTRVQEMDGQDLVGYNKEIGNSAPGVIGTIKAYYNGERYISSYFSRLNYTLKDRYLLGLSYRTDGSSAFNKQVRWGDFAAVSAGWIISDENFFGGLRNSISMLKLRGSYGQTGNQDIPTNENISVYSNSAGNRYGTKEIMPAGTGISIGNELITWEVTNSYDVGVDFGLFNDRVSGSVAYYMQNVTDLLLNVSTPPSAQIGSVKDNVGDLNNYGWEFSINTINIDKGAFSWSTSFNFTTNKNEIVRLTPEMERQKGNKLFVGGNLGLYKMAESAGIDPERGVRMIWEYDRAHFQETGEYLRTGRKIPATHTHLGQHAVVLRDKSKNPSFYGGMTNNFKYKGFDFGVLITFSGGNYLYNLKEYQWTSPLQGGYVLKSDLLNGAWTTPGQTDAKYPLLYTEGQAPATTKWNAKAEDPNFTDAEGNPLKGYWKYTTIEEAQGKKDTETYERQGKRDQTEFLQKGDYLRIKNITLGYTFPKSVTDKMRLNNMRMFFAATNLLTFTEFTGFDPESGTSNNLPPLRTFSGGLSITF